VPRFKRVAHYRVALRLVNHLTLTTAVLVVLAPVAATPAAPEPTAAGDAVEHAVVAGVNDVRRQHALPPLKPDPSLAETARRHSCDMAKRAFFSHTSPDGASMRDRLIKAGVRYRAAGENLASIEGPDPAKRAIEGWMKSAGHRENILSQEFTTTAVGACRAGRAVYITQLFVRPP
jgi:uncharacterized protein YkwD